MENVLRRNSGATLQPAMIKIAPNGMAQARKMALNKEVFAPVLTFMQGDNGYVMPMLGELDMEDESSVNEALRLLEELWFEGIGFPGGQARDVHHATQVLPLCPPELSVTLGHAWEQVKGLNVGCDVLAVHGDATIENVMMYQGRPVWIDPSTRPMPLEAEFDGGKLLQTQLGYGGRRPLRAVAEFLKAQKLHLPLLTYYLVTHIVRLYKVQEWARPWALSVAGSPELLRSKIEEVL